jgi:hypothetical protein
LLFKLLEELRRQRKVPQAVLEATMKKSWLTWLGLGAACAVCCAPLIAPLLAGAAGIGVTLSGVGLVEALCVAAIVAALAALGVLVLVRYRAARKPAACACALPGDAVQCEVDGVCAPGERGGSPP